MSLGVSKVELVGVVWETKIFLQGGDEGTDVWVGEGKVDVGEDVVGDDGMERFVSLVQWKERGGRGEGTGEVEPGVSGFRMAKKLLGEGVGRNGMREKYYIYMCVWGLWMEGKGRAKDNEEE